MALPTPFAQLARPQPAAAARRLAQDAASQDGGEQAAAQPGEEARAGGVDGAAAGAAQGGAAQQPEQQQAGQQPEQQQPEQQRAPPPPLTPEQLEQVAAHKALAVALNAGERVRRARVQAQLATTMQAPYSMMSPVGAAFFHAAPCCWALLARCCGCCCWGTTGAGR